MANSLTRNIDAGSGLDVRWPTPGANLALLTPVTGTVNSPIFDLSTTNNSTFVVLASGSLVGTASLWVTADIGFRETQVGLDAWGNPASRFNAFLSGSSAPQGGISNWKLFASNVDTAPGGVRVTLTQALQNEAWTAAQLRYVTGQGNITGSVLFEAVLRGWQQ
jgi:hypothetical protein